MSAIFGFTFHIGRMTEVPTSDIYFLLTGLASKTFVKDLSPFSTLRFFSREQAKSECDWVVMSSVFLASQ